MLIHGFLPVNARLSKVYDITFYAIICFILKGIVVVGSGDGAG